MSSVKNLLDVIDEINAQAAYLKQTGDTMNLLNDAFYENGVQQKDSFDEGKAIQFVRNFPAFMSTFQLIIREVERISEDLTGLGCAVVRLNGQKAEKDKEQCKIKMTLFSHICCD